MGINRERCGKVLVDMTTEVWKPVIDFEGRYEVSNFGRIKSLPKYTYSRGYAQLRKEKILTPFKTGSGYLSVVLFDKNGNKKAFKVHRLVATLFVSNELNLDLINHKDENIFNNRADNLEWCNNAYNVKYSAHPLSEEHKEKLRKPHRPLTDAEKQVRKDWANKNKKLLSDAGKIGAERRWKGVKY